QLYIENKPARVTAVPDALTASPSDPRTYLPERPSAWTGAALRSLLQEGYRSGQTASGFHFCLIRGFRGRAGRTKISLRGVSLPLLDLATAPGGSHGLNLSFSAAISPSLAFSATTNSWARPAPKITLRCLHQPGHQIFRHSVDRSILIDFGVDRISEAICRDALDENANLPP